MTSHRDNTLRALLALGALAMGAACSNSPSRSSAPPPGPHPQYAPGPYPGSAPPAAGSPGACDDLNRRMFLALDAARACRTAADCVQQFHWCKAHYLNPSSPAYQQYEALNRQFLQQCYSSPPCRPAALCVGSAPTCERGMCGFTCGPGQP